MKSTRHRGSTEAVGLGYRWRRQFVARTSVAPSVARACLNIFVRSSRRRDLLTVIGLKLFTGGRASLRRRVSSPSPSPFPPPRVCVASSSTDIPFRGRLPLRSTRRIFRHRALLNRQSLRVTSGQCLLARSLARVTDARKPEPDRSTFANETRAWSHLACLTIDGLSACTPCT